MLGVAKQTVDAWMRNSRGRVGRMAETRHLALGADVRFDLKTTW